MKEEGTLVRAHDLKPSPSDMYMLYFKGLVSKAETAELLAGFAIAILDQDENLLFQMKGPLHGSDVITDLEAELMALKLGLTRAVSMGITHLSICCNHDEIFELVMGRSAPALLMDDVQRIRQQLTSTIPVLVTDQNHQASFVTKLAMEAIDSEITIRMSSMTCSICLNNNFKAEDILISSLLCGHRFCKECVKRYIEVKLLQGGVPRCPYYQCESTLTLSSCASLLITPRLQEMWEERIKEESIPMADRVYCPNTNCSSLMSKTELSKYTIQGWCCCVKCTIPFCINCKVPWHDNMSCNDYKRLMGTNLTTEDRKLNLLANRLMWRQCEKCKHMIERSEGCIHVTCRCGYSFCYTCGAEWTKEKGCCHKEEMDANLHCIGVIVVSIIGMDILLAWLLFTKCLNGNKKIELRFQKQ
ncbi:probable E3 ubiquitin-protein ligase ARI10 [Capsella rubella]|uniref:probable E3 ubiquitin-protein ligase ARI10 n=1 Tax=Capsella rubella TaxID=81985 RepID=UPI000CD59792|nr:probable E3 ubiquitin-protein ligase ARI10 [Capsella rubella]